MVRIGEIVEFLREAGELAASPDLTPSQAAVMVVSVRREEEAGPGDLAWLSERRFAATPSRTDDFRGAILLAPAGAAGRAVAGATSPVVACRAPKAAFSMVVRRFLPELSNTSWPRVGESPVAPDARIGARVVIGHGVVIGPDTIVGDDVVIGPNACLAHSTVGARVRIGSNCSIGHPGFGYERGADGALVRFPHIGRVIIGDDVEIGSNTCVDRGALGDTRIEAGAKIDNLVHVAHNVVVGHGALVIADAMLGGSAVVGEDAWIAPSAAILNQVTIGARAVVGMGAVVLKDVAPETVVAGNPSRLLHTLKE